MTETDWGRRAGKGFLASGIDPADRRGRKNDYIDLLQKKALEEVFQLRGDETVLDFGCGSGRISYWMAPKVGKVVGLEVTPEMIDLAEKNRTAQNVEFVLYDGTNFPVFPELFDLILSVGVLQTMKGDRLKCSVFQLAQYLRNGGRGYFIEQVSDNPSIDRPEAKAYLQAFEGAKLTCLRHYPIRKGRCMMLYLIRYGLIPRKWLPRLALWELRKHRRPAGKIAFYKDFLFLVEKP